MKALERKLTEKEQQIRSLEREVGGWISLKEDQGPIVILQTR